MQLLVNRRRTYFGDTYVVPVGTIFNFECTKAVQEVKLSAGTYKLQCWGAQGAGIAQYKYNSQLTVLDAVYGGKGGYSEGILNLTSTTTLYIFVGGKPSDIMSQKNGGWNCGGGKGWTTRDTSFAGNEVRSYFAACGGGATDIALKTSSMSYRSNINNRSSASLNSRFIVAGGGSGGSQHAIYNKSTYEIKYAYARNGYAGGGVSGKQGTSGYAGTQDTAGTNGSFGKGSTNTGTVCPTYQGGCGGGGWYGGGSANGGTLRSGGGSGFVNTAENAQYRPSGYTGLQLDSGATYDGTTEFPAPEGGTEIGHEGDGYVRITRIS